MANLILVPTLDEMRMIRDRVGEAFDGWAFQVCGFGPITAAARTSALISRYKPERVMLVGIAGSFDIDQFPVGSACRFDQTICFGIGAGTGEHHQTAEQLGWKQFSGGDAQPQIRDHIALDSSFVDGCPAAGSLLTCCSASGNVQDAAERRARFPDVVAEDMEGFAVAVACVLASVPLQIVRGISNQVGDRDREHWQIEQAIDAAAQLAVEVAGRDWLPSQS